MSTVSVIIPTFNNEDIIKDCLESVGWAGEIIVVDSFSTDKTLDICRQYTNRIYQHEYVNSAAQKNWALDNTAISGDWVFLIDSDERVTPELKDEILEVVNQPRVEFAGYYLNRRTYAFGRWIRHGGWYPNYNVRLIRKGKGKFEDKKVHAELMVEGKTGYLEKNMFHYSYRTISQYLERMNHYSSWEAQDVVEKGTPRPHWSSFPKKAFFKSFFKWLYFVLPGKSVMTFLWMYFIRLGFLDGFQGFLVAALSSLNAFTTYAKARELRWAEKKKTK